MVAEQIAPAAGSNLGIVGFHKLGNLCALGLNQYGGTGEFIGHPDIGGVNHKNAIKRIFH